MPTKISKNRFQWPLVVPRNTSLRTVRIKELKTSLVVIVKCEILETEGGGNFQHHSDLESWISCNLLMMLLYSLLIFINILIKLNCSAIKNLLHFYLIESIDPIPIWKHLIKLSFHLILMQDVPGNHVQQTFSHCTVERSSKKLLLEFEKNVFLLLPPPPRKCICRYVNLFNIKNVM